MESYRIIAAVREEELEGYISALTLPILYFLRLEVVNDKEAREDMKTITKGFDIIPLDEEILSQAVKDMRVGDFEDLIQFHSAKQKANNLITRNVTHFLPLQDEINVFTPREFLTRESK